MAEALVSIALGQLAPFIRQQAREGISLTVGAKQEVEKLQSNFLSIQALLADAENRQVKENSVRVWLDKLKDVSYDIDDVLDEWNTKSLKLQIKRGKDASKPLKKVCSLVFHYLSCKPLVMRYEIAVNIKDLRRKLDIIATEKESFQFRSITESSKEVERPTTTSFIDLTEVRGRDKDKNSLVNLLLSQSSQQQVLPIISIVGMGGIGKTTLARLAFNNDKVHIHFDKKIWVCVSEPFDELRIAKAILESFVKESKLVELENIMQEIWGHIERKKFLLVLDDVWTENFEHWENLKHTLKCGSLESRILVTTRKESVANAIGTTNTISLGVLSEDESWYLFSQLANFETTNKEFEEIGKEIVKKCKGLPLAIKTLGSLLRFKRKFEEWKNVLNSEIWELKEVEQKIFPPLLFSYYDLSSILNKCFSYCAIFPKDYEIKKDVLIKLWMTQGYLKSEANKDMELVGEEYFKTLAMRSFFQDFQKDEYNIEIVSCKMHDIVHDFAQFLTQNECYTIEVDGTREIELESSYDKVRHLMTNIQEGASFPSSIYTRNTFLRSLIVVDYNYGTDCKIVFSKLVDQFTCLRSLSLNNCSIEVPAKIKKLIHLRYLNLSGNGYIEELPETLCELYNLQTLNIRWCENIKKLPQGIGNLINLRHLLNRGTNSITYLPKSLERLTSLRILESFVIREGSYGSEECYVECLKNLNHLREFGIEGLGNLRDVDEIKGIELNNKKNLCDLLVYFEGRMNEEQNQQLLEELQPPPNLETLVLGNYRGNTISPNWMMSLTNLKMLGLYECINCEYMPSLGKLSSLEVLVIDTMMSVKRVGNEFLTIESDAMTSSTTTIVFPKLKDLSFVAMLEWEEWSYDFTKRGEEDITIMPFLQTLGLNYCPKLKSLPNHLLQMTTLKKEIKGCPLLEEQRTYSRSSSTSDTESINFNTEFPSEHSFDQHLSSLNFNFDSPNGDPWNSQMLQS